MGATLPLLVTELVDLTHNVGFSTGTLYFINTLGAATGALAGGLILLSLYGLDGLVMIAAILNFTIAAVAYKNIRCPQNPLSFAIGLLSLGTETLWIRLFSYGYGSPAKALPFILGVYLLGIAFGAALGSRICKGERYLAEILAVSLLCGAAAVSLGPATVAASLRYGFFTQKIPTGLAFAAAFAFSICFPICHHLGTVVSAGKTGKSMSRVYAANIAGSVIGPLFVNFVLLQFGRTQLAFALLGLFAAAVALTVLLVCITSDHALKLAGLVGTLIATGSVIAALGLNNWLIASFHSSPIRRIVETRQGIVVSLKQDIGRDVILGGNAYDGRTNLDPRVNSNGINRVLVLAALKPNPKRVLMLGLSIGTWNYLGSELINPCALTIRS